MTAIKPAHWTMLANHIRALLARPLREFVHAARNAGGNPTKQSWRKAHHERVAGVHCGTAVSIGARTQNAIINVAATISTPAMTIGP